MFAADACGQALAPAKTVRLASLRTDGGAAMKLPRRTISASGRGCCRAAGGVAHRKGASLSDAAGAHHRWLCARRRKPTSSRASWASGCRSGLASHSSSRTGRARRPTSPPRRSCARPPTATRCSWSVRHSAINATLYDKLNFNFIRDIAPVAGIIRRAQRHGGEPIGSGHNSSGVHRLRQGESGQAQHGVGRHRECPATCPANCSR